MTTKARAGVGATFEVDSGSGYTYVADLVSIGGPEIAVEQVEATSLDSTAGYKEYIPGSLDGGTVSLTLNFSNSAAQRALLAMVGSIDVASFRVLLPTSPTSHYTFTGSVTAWTQSAEPNTPMVAELTFKTSGAIITTTGAFPLAFSIPAAVTYTAGGVTTYSGEDAPDDGVNSFTGYYSPIGTVDVHAGYSNMTEARDTRVHFTFPGSAVAGQAGNGITLKTNAVVHSAMLRFKCSYRGSGVTTGRFYAKKVQQSTVVATLDASSQWMAAGRTTSAYVTWTPSVGTAAVDVTPLINELLGSAEWDETDATVQFFFRSDTPPGDITAAPDPNVYRISFDRYDAPTFLTSLSISATQADGDPETAAITSGRVINYWPINAADLALANRVRYVVQNASNGRRSSTVLASNFSGLTGTTHNTTWKTTALIGNIFELGTWDIDAQAAIFGDAYANHADLLAAGTVSSGLGYTNGWITNFRDRDYLLLASFDYATTGETRLAFDLWNATTPLQNCLYVVANGATQRVEAECLSAGAASASTEGAQATHLAFATGVAPAANRTLRIALFWDHLTLTFNWRVWTTDRVTGATALVGSGSWRTASIMNPDSNTTAQRNMRSLVGFGWVFPEGAYGTALIEFTQPAAAVWVDTSNWMTAAWVRGVKSLDPRLMAA